MSVGEIADDGTIVGIVTKITMNKRAKSNSIRIIAGSMRGRRLPVLDRDGLRPTTDRVRETVFNWLMHDIGGANCLDLFAGSGVLGFECLSRGANHVQFVENDAVVAKTISSNLSTVLAPNTLSRASIECSNAIAFLKKQPQNRVDLVFLDPPFASNLLAEVLPLLIEYQWLNNGALIYLEQNSGSAEVLIPEGWQLYRSGQAGQSRYCLYAS